MDNLNILMASPEAVPFVKTGGLADVTGALPDAIASLGHTIKVILPLYKSIKKDSFGLKPYPNFPEDLKVTVNGKAVSYTHLRAHET